MQGLMAGIAALLGIVLGFWLRSFTGKQEKALTDRRDAEQAAQLAALRNELALAQTESARRAGFESLAAERERTIGQLAAERDGLREQLQAAAATDRTQNARISQLQAELNNERQNLADQAALHRSTDEALIAERAETVGRLERERNVLREELRVKTETERVQAARISQLEADLRNERKNLADQVALLDATKQGLSSERTETVGRLESELNALRGEVRVKSETDRAQAASISKLEAELKNERDNLAEKLTILENAKEALANQFEALAAEILEKKSKSFAEGSQRDLGTLLDPLKVQIAEFRAKVEEAQKESLVGKTELSEQLKNLKGLNEKLSAEAHALTNVLTRDTREQGHWGELVLLDILEDCDLKRGTHYTYQQSFVVDDEGDPREERKQTDVVLRFPEGRSLIIDSKVTLIAHKDYVEAADEIGRKDALNRLITSIRNHIRQLASKNYQDLIGERSPDYVVLFAPNEAAYLLAVQADPKLITDGYKSRVLIAGPTTILHIARIVESLWRNENRAKSLQQIGKSAKLLFEKFTLFVAALEDARTAIRKAAAEIGNAEHSHDEAMKRLTSGKGNLVTQAEKLGKLGDKSAKQIAPRVLDMAEEEDPELELLLAEDSESTES